MQHLYEISKVLTRFEGVERTVPEVIAIFVRTLPIRNAIFILEAPLLPHLLAWQAENENAHALREVTAHARTIYSSLVRSETDVDLRESRIIKLPDCGSKKPSEREAQLEKNFILLPLVVAQGSIFGALQIEGVDRLEEIDLVFMNAVVNQVAIAVDRNAIILAEQAAAHAREEKLQFLSEATTVLASSLDYRETLATVVRLSVPLLADVCFIDEVTEDGKIRRLEVVFADRNKQDPAPRPRPGSPATSWPPALEDVAFSSARLLVPEVIIVPLLARGRTLGALKLVMAESGRRYSAAELAFAEELARRAGIAIDNARLYQQAQRAIHAREELLAIVSHDLRNLLGVILMSLAMQSKSLEKENWSKSKEQLARTQLTVGRMRRLIEDLLDMSSIEAGHLAIETRSHSVDSLVSEALDAAQPLAAHKLLRLESKLAAELPLVSADGPRLQQVFANLLGNAVKFTPEGGTIVVRAEPADDAVTFSVTDTGSGIGEKELPHVFDRFWKGERADRVGKGLGLFIAEAIVKAHGGTIGVDSHVGEGSTFFFTLPVTT